MCARLPNKGFSGPGKGDKLRFFDLIVGSVSIEQHALMQDAGNKNTVTLPAVEHNVLAMLQAAQAGTHVITGPA